MKQNLAISENLTEKKCLEKHLESWTFEKPYFKNPPKRGHFWAKIAIFAHFFGHFFG